MNYCEFSAKSVREGSYRDLSRGKSPGRRKGTSVWVESLDCFESALQRVVGRARSLTATIFGMMIMLDDAGQVQDALPPG